MQSACFAHDLPASASSEYHFCFDSHVYLPVFFHSHPGVGVGLVERSTPKLYHSRHAPPAVTQLDLFDISRTGSAGGKTSLMSIGCSGNLERSMWAITSDPGVASGWTEGVETACFERSPPHAESKVIRRMHRDLIMSANGPHQRPRADLSARGRAALNRAPSSAARGQALYASRRAACVC